MLDSDRYCACLLPTILKYLGSMLIVFVCMNVYVWSMAPVISYLKNSDSTHIQTAQIACSLSPTMDLTKFISKVVI